MSKALCFLLVSLATLVYIIASFKLTLSPPSSRQYVSGERTGDQTSWMATESRQDECHKASFSKLILQE